MNYSPCNGFTLSQVKLINLFRKLWEQHDVWTRSTIISIAFGSEAEWRKMLHEHLRLVKADAVDILTGNYSAGIAVYDAIERHTLGNSGYDG